MLLCLARLNACISRLDCLPSGLSIGHTQERDEKRIRRSGLSLLGTWQEEISLGDMNHNRTLTIIMYLIYISMISVMIYL